jgi:hypothetical protein
VYNARKGEADMAEATSKPHLRGLNHYDPVTSVEEIDAMSVRELEYQLPKALDALEAIESKLEELMSLKDAALVCAAAMEARLVTLKQAKG